MRIQYLLPALIFIAFFSYSDTLFGQPSNVDLAKNNSVLIQQIGVANTSVAEISSQQGQIALVQLGARNEVNFHMKAKKIKGLVLQKGIDNKVFNVAPNPRETMKTVVLQRGYNQNLLMLCGNSMSENMTIRMRGKNQTVVVRNIKRRR